MAMTAFSYQCNRCPFYTGILDLAIEHANEKKHVVLIRGSILPVIKEPTMSVEERAAERMREGEILRAARDKGLLPKDGVR